MASYKIRIIARACITRYDAGEGTMQEIMDSYGLASKDRDPVLTQIAAWRPDIELTA
jgi:hypothetical protein